MEIPDTSTAETSPWAARAREVGEIAGEAIAETEAGRTLAPAVVDAMKETGLVWMLVPRELGGGGASIVDFIEATEILCEIDASAGWAFMVNASITGAAAAFCDEAAVMEMFSVAEPAIMAGMLGPGGTAVEVPGGYRGGGNFSFGSGSAHATWIGGGMFVIEDGRPRQGPDGQPEVRIGFFRKDQVVMRDNWHVMGLGGTGSFDYAIVDQTIADGFTMSRTSTTPRRGQGLFRLGLAGLACAGHAGVALGLMRRSLHEIAVLAQDRQRPGYPGKLDEHPMFLDDFGTAEADCCASRDYLYAVFARAERRADEGGEPTPTDRARIRQVTTWVHRKALDVIERCYKWSGSDGFREPSRIGVAMRDIHVANQHVFVDPASVAAATAEIIRDWQVPRS